MVLAEVDAIQQTTRGQSVSRAALEIHVRAVERSVRTRYPAFVSYADLDGVAVGPATTLAALELCLNGLWVQGRDGYVIADIELIERLSHSPLPRALAQACRRLWRALNSESVIPL